YSAKKLEECYRLGAEKFGWNQPPAESLEQPRREGIRRVRGMASVCWGAGGGPPAYATVRVNPDGTVEVLTGSQDLGTGARTVFAQIAAEAIGANTSQVRTV